MATVRTDRPIARTDRPVAELRRVVRTAALLDPDHRRVLAGSDLLAGLPPGVREDLFAVLAVTRFVPGQSLVRPDQAGERLWIVLSGRVGITSTETGGLLAVMEAGDALGEIQVFDPGLWTFSATAMSSVVIASAGRDDVLAWVGRHPSVSAHLLQRMARRLAAKSRAARHHGAADAPGRVARGVLDLADRYTVGGVVQHGLTQTQLADILGLSREKVNKSLSRFCELSWLELGRGVFTVLDRAALERRAEVTELAHRSAQPSKSPAARR